MRVSNKCLKNMEGKFSYRRNGYMFMIVLFLQIAAGSLSAEEKVTINQNGIQVNVLASTDAKTTLEVKIGEYYRAPVKINRKTYYSIKLQKESVLLTKGSPDLPKISRSIVIPPTALMSATVRRGKYIDYSLQIAPSKGSLSLAVDPATVAYTFSNVYNTHAFYPAKTVSLRAPYILRDSRGITIDIMPFAYNPVTKKCRVYTYLLIDIANTGTDTRNILAKQTASVTSQFDDIYNRHFLNYRLSKVTRADTVDAIADNGRMLVITPNSYVSAIRPLVDWKNSQGLPTTIKTLPNSGYNQDTIKEIIQKEYAKNDGLMFVLLVGSRATVPSYRGACDP